MLPKEAVMRLFLREKPDIEETEVEIRYRTKDREVEDLIRTVNSSSDLITGINDRGDTEIIYASEILYVEAVDRGVFVYRKDDACKVRNTLYELEDRLKDRCFVRISKSTLVNIGSIRSIAPEDARRVKLLLRNGEYLIVSRNYVNDLKAAIGMKGGSRR